MMQSVMELSHEMWIILKSLAKKYIFRGIATKDCNCLTTHHGVQDDVKFNKTYTMECNMLRN